MKTRVKELRAAAGLTQQQLVEQVHVSSRTIISIEKGQYSPSLMLAYRIALVFHTSSWRPAWCWAPPFWGAASPTP